MTRRYPITLPWSRSTTQRLTPEALSARYLTVVLRYAAARLGAGPEAEDVATEVFVAAYAAWHRCPTPAPDSSEHDPVRAWLFGIARNKVADVLRRRQRRPEFPLLESTLAAPFELGVLEEEEAQQLATLLASLPDDQREALRLKYIEELSLVEIGLILHRSPAAVGTLLHRARLAARERGRTYFEEKTR